MQTTRTTPQSLLVKTEAQSSLKRVLCVEDDRDTCDFLKFVMTSYEFHAVHTIGSAVDLISERPFDMYVLDNWLPDGSGIELCRYIRNGDSNVPIIFTSAIGQRQDIELAIEAGANRYLVKPYEPDALLQTVKELINPAGDLVFES
jgi:DNA-binding response OmpR family regulator